MKKMSESIIVNNKTGYELKPNQIELINFFENSTNCIVNKLDRACGFTTALNTYLMRLNSKTKNKTIIIVSGHNNNENLRYFENLKLFFRLNNVNIKNASNSYIITENNNNFRRYTVHTLERSIRGLKNTKIILRMANCMKQEQFVEILSLIKTQMLEAKIMFDSQMPTSDLWHVYAQDSFDLQKLSDVQFKFYGKLISLINDMKFQYTKFELPKPDTILEE